MTQIEFNGKCPSCGYQFDAGEKISGSKLEGANGVCCWCAEVLRVEPDRSLRPITAKEYLFLSPQDAFGIAMLVARSRAEKAARDKAVTN